MSFKKRASKSIALALIGVAITSPIINTASAMEEDVIDTPKDSIEVSIDDKLQESEIEGLKQYYTENNINFSENKTSNGDVEIVVNDVDVYKAAKNAGYNVDMSVLRARANGVNKITWRKDGGFDLYVSKNSLLLISGAGIGAIGFLLGPFAPGTIAIISGAVSMYVGGNISNGRVFRFIKVKVNKYDYKYAYLKSWAQ